MSVWSKKKYVSVKCLFYFNLRRRYLEILPFHSFWGIFYVDHCFFSISVVYDIYLINYIHYILILCFVKINDFMIQRPFWLHRMLLLYL